MGEVQLASAYKTTFKRLIESCDEYANAKSGNNQKRIQEHKQNVLSFSEILLSSTVSDDLDRDDAIFRLEGIRIGLGKRIYCQKIVPIIRSLEKHQEDPKIPHPQLPLSFTETPNLAP